MLKSIWCTIIPLNYSEITFLTTPWYLLLRCTKVKISLYLFNDLSRCYGIVEFTGSEVGLLLKGLSELDIREAKEVFEKIHGVKVKSLSLSTGKMMYDNEVYDMVYARVEYDDGNEVVFEVYRDSMTVISNTSIADTYVIVQELLRFFSAK